MLISLILAAALATAAPRTLDDPPFEAAPTGGDMLRYYPLLAQMAERPGRVVVGCTVNADGTVGHCTVESETPRGWGFGDAALKLTTLFKLKPKTKDGKSVAGAAIHTPITFKIAGDSPSGLNPYLCYTVLLTAATDNDTKLAASFAGVLHRMVVSNGGTEDDAQALIAHGHEDVGKVDSDRLLTACRNNAPRR